jgi:hypothetical protein
MSARFAACPSCGARIEFANSASLIVVCESCEYVSYRTDVKLELIGKVAQVAPIESALALHARGKIDGSGFEIVGQVQLDHGKGPWNEWAIAFDDGKSAWLAEAQGQILFTREVDGGGELRYASIAAGAEIDLGASGRWTVAEKGSGRVTAIRGQLPELIKPDSIVHYADLSGEGDGFGTFDFGAGDACEAIYLGRRLSAADLALDLSGAAAPAERKVRAARITCPKCAGAIDLRDPENTQRVGCPFCGALLDPRSKEMQVLGVSLTTRSRSALPIGAKGRISAQEFEVLAWLERSVVEEGVRFPWEEYLLRRGDGAYRWLVCSDRQWSFVEPLNLADVKRSSSRVSYRGRSFRRFSGGEARVDRVLDEVYWEVSVGETVRSDDYVDPPLMISFETTEGEKIASLGTYLERAAVETAFGLKQKLPSPTAIGAIQPNPVRADLRRWWKSAAVITAIVLGLDLFFHVAHTGKIAHAGKYPLVPISRSGDTAAVRPSSDATTSTTPSSDARTDTSTDSSTSTSGGMHAGSSSSTLAPIDLAALQKPADLSITAPIVSDEFELDGWRGNVEVEVSAPALQHGALNLEGCLVSSSSGEKHSFAVQTSGTSSEDLAGAHSIERASVRIGGVPGGRYRLRLDPHSAIVDPNGTFEIVVKRQLASSTLPIVIVILCWLAPLVLSIAGAAIEGVRWQKSDYA